jgi:hypothetical protein
LFARHVELFRNLVDAEILEILDDSGDRQAASSLRDAIATVTRLSGLRGVR